METVTNNIQDALQQMLDKREEESLYRSLQVQHGLIDFCSNDYLSFARSVSIARQARNYFAADTYTSGATGSRSISGNTVLAEELEKFIANFHEAEAGLLFNSGYDANVGLFSSIAKKEDTLICDELIHASIIDGCRLSYANRFRFAHNDTEDLEKKLKNTGKGNVFVAVESVYSMDGDMAPLNDIVALCKRYEANLIVDEAHATGVFGRQGRGLVHELGLQADVFARVHTFGKAIGSHGAIITGSKTLRNYLINFARSFIFTTALPAHSLLTTKAAYNQLLSNDFDNSHLYHLIKYFKKDLVFGNGIYLIESSSPVQSLVIPGNEKVRSVASQLQQMGFDVRAILSPSVPAGKERLRISLHIHNTIEQTELLKQALIEILKA